MNIFLLLNIKFNLDIFHVGVATCGWKSSGISSVRTTKTSHGAWRTIASDTEPTKNVLQHLNLKYHS